jgi:hypothetical protein
MNNIIKNLILCLLLMSCGCATIKSNKNVDSDVQPYLNDFITALKKTGQSEAFQNPLSQLSIKLVPAISNSNNPFLESSDFHIGPQNQLMGRCFIDSNRVEIDENVFNESDDNVRQLLIDHELGHCILKRIHRNGFHPTIPGENSVMAEHFSNIAIYNEIKDYYRTELFDSSMFYSLDILNFYIKKEYKEYHHIFRDPSERYQKELNLDAPMSSDLNKLIKEYQQQK